MSAKTYSGVIKFICLFICFSANAQNSGEAKKWWKETVFYQIYMPSYADSNGDGYGDFGGITGKLDYLQEIGVRGVWLTPFLSSPKVDNGYDVADYYTVDPIYGTNTDFDHFLKEAHKRGIKVIMDMVLNHTSTESRWFQEAVKFKDNPYRDYYIWEDKPNNWESFFGGSAWKIDTKTNQYYYHKFDEKMADLNWANPKVVDEVQTILRFWLNKGVDGFRLDVINFITTDGITADNPSIDGKQQHIYDIDQKGVKNAIKIIRATVNEYNDRFTVGEIGSDKIDVLKQYQSGELLDVVFNFNFGSIPSFSVQRIFKELQSMEENMSGYPTLFFGSHDMPRMIDRLADGNTKKAEALAALLLTAKGVPFIYYGEEIGMHNIIAHNFDEIKDIQGKTAYKMAIEKGAGKNEALDEANKQNRDKSRSPMQWNTQPYSGFSAKQSWIKINKDYRHNNVAALKNNNKSILAVYTKLIALRNNEPALQYGRYIRLEYKDDMIIFTREFEGETITVIVNFGPEVKIDVPLNSKMMLGSTTLGSNEYCIYKTQ